MPTRKELADGLGVSRQALNTWEREGCPMDSIAAADEWRKANKRPRFWSEAEADADGTLQERLLSAQIREKNAAAEAKEMKNAERRGELMESEDVAQDIAVAMSILSARLEAIPDELRKELPADCKERVTSRAEEMIVLALKEVAAKMREAGHAA